MKQKPCEIDCKNIIPVSQFLIGSVTLEIERGYGMTIIYFAIAMVIGGIPLMFLPQLPNTYYLTTIFILTLCALQLCTGQWRVLSWAVLGFCWSCFVAHQHINLVNRMSDQRVTVLAEVKAIEPERDRIRVILRRSQDKILFPPLQAWIYGPPHYNYCPGQYWVMELRLRPIHSLLNEFGYDQQRIAFAKQTPWQAKLYSQQVVKEMCSFRGRLLSQQSAALQSLTYRGILAALAYGQREQVTLEINQLFKQTGVAHLMAISGMHIGLMYAIGWGLGRGLQWLFATRWIDSLFSEFTGVLLASAYCWLSGGSPSSLRAIFALIFWLIARRSGANFTSWHILLLCAATLIVIDPLIVLSESFWLSFLAVSSLLICYRWFPLPPNYRYRKRWYWLQLIHLQAGMMLLMIPIQVLIFQGASLSAIPSNLLAIPTVTLIVMPLIALALLSPITLIEQLAWGAADYCLKGLVILLKHLPNGWYWMDQSSVWAAWLWGGLMIILFGWWKSYPICCFALAIVLTSIRPSNSDLLWRIDMLDVGHGLAVIISQHGEAIIYDTGNLWQRGDAGKNIIIPWLLSQRLTPILVVISHSHLDHRGGLTSILQQWPNTKLWASYPLGLSEPCRRGINWRWQKLAIEVLWPLRLSRLAQNNDSCVLSISDGRYRIILTGDLEKSAERELVSLGPTQLKATFLQVPHHGSRTSSSALFLRKVMPNEVLASVARYNPWGLPSQEVVQRYQLAGYNWYDTAVSGQISIRIRDNHYEILQMREQIVPRWYHQWFGKKPNLR